MSVAKPDLVYGLGQHTITRLNSVFAMHPNIKRVSLYGSRAKGDYRTGSDIDLCLDAPNLHLHELLAIDTEIDDLLMPWKVDLTHKQNLDNSELLDHIQRVGVQVYPSP